MANFSALKTAIQNAIKQNGNEEITGDVLQQILTSIVSTMGDVAINTIEQNLSNETTTRQGADTQLQNAINAIKSNIDNGYVYAGIAKPSTTPVSGKVFYAALQAGTYTNFGGTAVTEGITFLKHNGTSWIKEQVLFTDGGVFDISAYHATGGTLATYADLSAALGTNGANVPANVRKGGMSVKYVHSYDNKYVQFRCMAQNFTTDVTQWQGVDDEPTAGSDNLVKSGGIAKYGYQYDGAYLFENTNIPIRKVGGFINGRGIYSRDTTAIYVLIPCSVNDKIKISPIDSSSSSKYSFLRDATLRYNETVSYVGDTPTFALNEDTIIEPPTGCNYLYVLIGRTEVYITSIKTNIELIKEIAFENKNRISVIENNIDELGNKVLDVYGLVDFYYDINVIEKEGFLYKQTGKFIPGSGIVSNNESALILLIPFIYGQSYVIKGTTDCKYTFLSDNKLLPGQIAPFCDGYTTVFPVNGTKAVDAPSDCKYLYILAKSNNIEHIEYVTTLYHNTAREYINDKNTYYIKSYTTDKNFNNIFTELFFEEQVVKYSEIARVSIRNCNLDTNTGKYYVGLAFYKSTGSAVIGKFYAFDTIEEAREFRKGIFVSDNNLYALIDFDAACAEGEYIDRVAITLTSRCNLIYSNPFIYNYLTQLDKDKHLRFAIISDPHFREAEAENESGVYRNGLMLDALYKYHKIKTLDFIISGGDTGVAYINRGVLDKPLPAFRNKILSKLPIPFFSALGNHDGFTEKEWNDCFFHDTQFSVETDGFYFIFLDVYKNQDNTHTLKCAVGTDTSSAKRQLLAQYGVEVNENGYCLLQDVLDIPELSSQFENQVNYEYQGIDFDYLESELNKAAKLGKKIFVINHTIIDDTAENKNRFNHLIHDYNAIYIKGHEHYSYHNRDVPGTISERYIICPGWFATEWGGYGGNQTPWAIDVVDINNGNLRVIHYIPAQTHTVRGETYNIEESETVYVIESSDRNSIKGTYNIKSFNNFAFLENQS